MTFRNEYWFMSNMYPIKVEYDGDIYECVESAFQAAKCKDRAGRSAFKGIDGFTAKKLGRRVALRSDWESIKLSIMENILRNKFRGSLLSQLKAIVGEIVEDNSWGDRYWGRCNGVGSNYLGKLLMKLRDE